ncbi:hypothetical protein A4X13_0g8135, partial [Tilletia indica]
MVITGVFHDPSSTDRQGKHRREKKGPDEGQQERHGYIEEFPRHPLLQLGLRILVAAVLQIYVKPHNLSTLLTMQPDEKAALARDPTMLEVKRPGLRSLSHEMKAFTRHELYLSGGLLSVNARFFVLIHLVEHRVENCHGERSTQPHTLIAMIASIFNSSDSIIGLNTAEMMNNLLGFIDRQVHYHTKDPLLESLVESVSSLGAYVFYADQIQNTSFSLHCTVRSERQVRNKCCIYAKITDVCIPSPLFASSITHTATEQHIHEDRAAFTHREHKIPRTKPQKRSTIDTNARCCRFFTPFFDFRPRLSKMREPGDISKHSAKKENLGHTTDAKARSRCRARPGQGPRTEQNGPVKTVMRIAQMEGVLLCQI